MLQGTAAFMSAEILLRAYLFPRRQPESTLDPPLLPSAQENNVPKHDVRHDMESMFWCLVYICLCRDGPGTVRPEVLKMLRPGRHRTFTHAENELGETIRCLFASIRESGLVKEAILVSESSRLRNQLSTAIAPFFRPLSPLIDSFATLLSNCHRDRETDIGIHDKVVELFCDAQKDLSALSKSVADYDKRVVDIQHKFILLAEFSKEEKDDLLAKWHTNECDTALRQKQSITADRILDEKKELEQTYASVFRRAPCQRPSVRDKWDQMAKETMRRRAVGSISDEGSEDDVLDLLAQGLADDTTRRARESVGDSPTPVAKRPRIL
jgi:hypothetical protein